MVLLLGGVVVVVVREGQELVGISSEESEALAGEM